MAGRRSGHEVPQLVFVILTDGRRGVRVVLWECLCVVRGAVGSLEVAGVSAEVVACCVMS